MKKIVFVALLGILVGCGDSGSKDEKVPETAPTGSLYYAEYGVPNQNLIQSCSGQRDLVRPVSRCIRRANNQVVDSSLCYNLEPVYMTIPSPAGDRETPITGGRRLDTCHEGSIEIVATNYVCNVGFFLQGTRCFGYETVGSYAIQKDQVYKEKDGIKILMTIGHEFTYKIQDNLQLIMNYE